MRLPEFPPDRPAPKEIDLHYYTFNIGDYRRDTSHLNLLEHGIYRQLIDTYYLSEEPLCLDDAILMRTHCVRSAEDKQAFKNVLQDFFELREDGWHHKGCERVIKHYQVKSEKASTSAKARWAKDANALPTQSEANANHKPITNNQEPITNNQEDTYICPPRGEPAVKDGLPDCQHQAVIDLYHQHLPTLRKVEVWNAARQGYLRQRWREVAAELPNRTAVDVLTWWAEFFQHIAKSKFLTGRIQHKDGRAFAADLEWILKPSNFAKIIEGKYHGF